MNAHREIACMSALLLSACAGDGNGLDENGRPAAGAQEPVLPRLSSIQSRVFTPICTACHSGASAPLGLRLDAEASYAMLVDAPSVEVPALMRIAPGNPDSSYLIHKIEGTAAVGGRMPLNGPPLAPETIAAIRQWIAEGAQPVEALVTEKPAQLSAAWPPPGAALRKIPHEIVLSSDVELDTTLLGAGVVTLLRSSGDGNFDDANQHTIPVSIAVRSLESTVIVLTAPPDEFVADSYELRVSGGAPLALADRAARPIDGDRDGEPGGDFVLRFTLEGVK